MRKSVEERFFEKVDFSDDCWTWTSWISTSGYGLITIKGKTVTAHRWAYETLVRPIPEGLVIDHLCRNRLCVNPDHLEPVTNRENIMRGEGVAARRAQQTHCMRGHEFTPENTYVYRDGRARKCRACERVGGKHVESLKAEDGA